jgi:endonuclease/exonuclease/phosphatase family metal-dependent hydrolase
MSTNPANPILFYEYVSTNSHSPESSQWSPVSSHPPNADRISSFRVITWNIWFDRREQHVRFSAVLTELLSIPLVDVICLQEVTTSFLDLIRADKSIRRDWLITDYTDENHRWEVVPSWYGNIFLVRKVWAGNIQGWVKRFPSSRMGRFALVMEIVDDDKCMVLLTSNWNNL